MCGGLWAAAVAVGVGVGAAANPVFGRYDDMKSPTENIEFQTTILSRFDIIFIIKDVQNKERWAGCCGGVSLELAAYGCGWCDAV